ncbi:MAG: hypothetical protein ABIL06_16075 [Pseudomonadota bacterium]
MVNIPERDGLARTGRAHQENETVVKLGCLLDPLDYLIGKGFHHQYFPLYLGKDVRMNPECFICTSYVLSFAVCLS